VAVPGALDRPDQPRLSDLPDQDNVPGQLRSPSPRPEPLPKTDRPDETGPADRAAATDDLVAWSRADLQERLGRLPPGHPSSPRIADLSRDQRPGLRDLDVPSPGDKTEQDHSAGTDHPDREPDAVKRDYWREVPRFFRAWADHVRRWPAEKVAATVDRSQDQAGSWRGDGGQYMNPEEHTQAKDEIATLQRKEEALTKQMGQAERENAVGGWLAGLEFCLKGEDRLKEKIAELLETTSAQGTTPAQIVRDIPDAIRYTFCFEPSKYADGYWDLKHRLETNESRMIYSKNHWCDDPEYKGINTRWVTPEGQRFEVQFHTPESFHAKQQVTHHAYERSRNRLTGRSERLELEAFQREVCTFITGLGEVESIPDYKEEGS
jgi:hypothetical protein